MIADLVAGRGRLETASQSRGIQRCIAVSDRTVRVLVNPIGSRARALVPTIAARTS